MHCPICAMSFAYISDIFRHELEMHTLYLTDTEVKSREWMLDMSDVCLGDDEVSLNHDEYINIETRELESMDNIEFNIQDFNENIEDSYMGTDENFEVCLNKNECVKRKASNDGCNIQQSDVKVVVDAANEEASESEKNPEIDQTVLVKSNVITLSN